MIFVVLSLLLVGVPLLVYSQQEKMLFFPEVLPTDYQFNFPGDWEERWFATEKDNRLHALHFHAEGSSRIVLYFHGNAGSLASWGDVAQHFTSRGYDLLIIDYRGYGKSTGKIKKERHLHEDASVVYNALLAEYSESDIVLYGRSLGTGMAAKLAAENKPAKLLLETPYWSMINVAKHHVPWLPVKLILKYKLKTFEYLPAASCPIELIHGTQDEVIPYNSSTRLAELGDHIQCTTVEGGQHNNLSVFPAYGLWLDRVLREN